MPRPKHLHGFSLVEMAIVLLIIGLLIGGLVTPLSQQMTNNRIAETQATQSKIEDALMGFAAGNGRLPCPAIVGSSGNENPTPSAANGLCTNPFDGFLPGRQLGLTPLDPNGFVIDAWGNPIRYAVATTVDPVSAGGNRVVTTPDGIRTMGVANFASQAASAANGTLLQICASSGGVGTAGCGIAANSISADAVFVLYSYGPTGIPSSGPDETMDNASSQFFISHPPTDTDDHIVQWMPRSLYISRLIAAGRLP